MRLAGISSHSPRDLFDILNIALRARECAKPPRGNSRLYRFLIEMERFDGLELGMYGRAKLQPPAFWGGFVGVLGCEPPAILIAAPVALLWVSNRPLYHRRRKATASFSPQDWVSTILICHGCRPYVRN